MTYTKETAQKLAQELKARNDLGESWRAIAESFGSPIIKPGTLCSWVNGVKDLPKEYLKPLGLVKPKPPKSRHQKRIERKIGRMAKETRKAIFRRK